MSRADWNYRIVGPMDFGGTQLQLAVDPARFGIQGQPSQVIDRGGVPRDVWTARFPPDTLFARLECPNGRLARSLVCLPERKRTLFLKESVRSAYKRLKDCLPTEHAGDMAACIPDLDPSGPEAADAWFMACEITGALRAVRLLQTSRTSDPYIDFGGRLALATDCAVPPTLPLLQVSIALDPDFARSAGLPRQMAALMFADGCFGTAVQNEVDKNGHVVCTAEKEFIWVPSLKEESEHEPSLWKKMCQFHGGPQWLTPVVEAGARLGV